MCVCGVVGGSEGALARHWRELIEVIIVGGLGNVLHVQHVCVNDGLINGLCSSQNSLRCETHCRDLLAVISQK